MSDILKDLENGWHLSKLGKMDLIHFMQVASFCLKFTCLQQVSYFVSDYDLKHVKQEMRSDFSSQEMVQGSPFLYISVCCNWTAIKVALSAYIGTFSEPDHALQVHLHSNRGGSLLGFLCQEASLCLLNGLLFVLDESCRSGTEDDKKAANRLQRR